MSKCARGFSSLRGKTITKVHAGAINEVKLTDSDGNVWVLCAETNLTGIPMLSLEKEIKTVELKYKKA